jgi:hypothetical protein
MVVLLLSLWSNRVATTMGLEAGLKSNSASAGMDEWPELTIGEVARRAGVASSAIRYYESIGRLGRGEGAARLEVGSMRFARASRA